MKTNGEGRLLQTDGHQRLYGLSRLSIKGATDALVVCAMILTQIYKTIFSQQQREKK